MDMWLSAVDPRLRTLRDFKAGQQIGLPASDSIEALALQKGAEDQLGNAHALDVSMLAISHPLGEQSLFTGQLAGHLTAPPFQFQEVDRGAHVVFSSKDAFGESTFNAAAMTTAFYEQYPDFAKAFLNYMMRADQLIARDSATAGKIVAEAEGRPQDASKYKAWMTHAGDSYTVVPSGFFKYAAFMRKIGIITKVPSNVKDIELPPLQSRSGS